MKDSISIPAKPNRCPACRSKLLTYVKDVMAAKTQRSLPLYYCMECESFCNPSGFLPSDEYKQETVEFHKGIYDRNTKFCVELFQKLLELRASNKKIVEIGCGIGTLLKYASSLEISGIGYDLNKYACDYGISKFDLDLRCEEWNSSLSSADTDWIFLISVLEHIEKPEILISEIARFCQRSGAYLYISVPFLERPLWKFVQEPKTEGTPFFDCDEHVMHFSRRGLKRLLQLWWAKEIEPVTAGYWNGFVVKF